jgi:long-chain acyl-CoA synthetase
MFKHASVALMFSMVAATGQAAEVAGVKVPDSAKVGNSDLLLNGAGLRTRMVVKVYVGALYLAEKKTAAADALASKGAKRIALHLLRDLSAEQLSGALSDGLNDNLSEAERMQYKVQIDDLKATLEAVGAAREKSVITIDFVPDSGMRIALDGAGKGKVIAGEDFYRALMKIWLGEKPVDKGLKAGMLGQG